MKDEISQLVEDCLHHPIGWHDSLKRLEDIAREGDTLRGLLRETVNLAFICVEGDPWYADAAQIDTNDLFTRVNEALHPDSKEE